MWTLTLTTVFLFLVTKYLYRLYFHPLRSVPGPKLAAMTHLHEFYYDVVRGGMFIWEVKRMHEKYGPIVRINPREVHIVDFAFYDEIYAGAGRRRDKDPQMVAFLASPHAALATVDHDLHRSRRNQLNPFFSKKSVGALMPVIYEKVDLLCEHRTMAAKEMTVINLSDAFVALTGDIITHYLYGQDTGCLASKHFANNGIWAAVVYESLRLGAVAMRPSRVAPHETLHYNGYAIPPGTPMSTSSYFLHRNPEIFPNPESFDPERWITASERGANLSKYLVPFTRGTRACIGINLSYAEIYTTLATIVCRFDLELCDTAPERMAFTREMIVQRPEEGVWTLKARVVGAREDRS
ncbi:cytochrome P450 [Aspergillus fijiensis CBS 313.89]|uniref:Cytochrome P450 n=1 Tax=Aspergillus fijiensis CBS 313.89 TaxID=1448319 RepID=A0A8G1W0C2_9EURO|nr:cytochrome P450 [Aspergillus fijiensis CBS 313.89]RAK75874.1 cytochrome P450 [Aspergillus fijiensis CBS 313.89]